LHTVDARVAEEHVEGAGIIGWDPARNAYITQYFGSDGPNAYEASLAEEDGALAWNMRSRTDRFRGGFGDDGNTITGHWEQLDDGEQAAVDGDHADEGCALTGASFDVLAEAGRQRRVGGRRRRSLRSSSRFVPTARLGTVDATGGDER
jgi:hypothetical protein